MLNECQVENPPVIQPQQNNKSAPSDNMVLRLDIIYCSSYYPIPLGKNITSMF